MAITPAGETFYSALGGTVISQIRKRESLTADNSKDIDALSILNQNTGFIKVTSGNNIVSSDGKKTYSGPAQRFILHGGAMMSEYMANERQVNQLRSGVNFDKNVPFNKSGQAYNNYSGTLGLGYRPMPGIVSFNLQTYNTFGTLRQADIQFVVWTLEDLEQAEKLYLRPGFTAVIEFGHSVYVDNNGDKQTLGKTFSTIDENFLFKKQTIKNIEKAIENKREASHGNYDGFFGYVSNFSYSFRPDGGYDCSMKVVSKGIILDSLKSGNVSDAIQKPKQDETSDQKPPEAAKKEIKSVFHTMFRSIQNYHLTGIQDEEDTASIELDKKKLDDIIADAEEKGIPFEPLVELATKDKCEFVFTTITANIKNQDDETELQQDELLAYIPLRFVLDVFNKLASLYEIGDTKRNFPLLKFSTEFGNKFRTFRKHFSTAPSMVCLPKTAPSIEHPEGTGLYSMTSNNADTNMSDYAGSGNSSDGNGSNEILNIFVSTKFLLSILDKVYNEDSKELTTLDFFNSLLKNINTSFSDVCRLTLFYNEGLNEYEIVDAHGGSKVRNIPIIHLSGLKSTAKQVSIQSRLSSQTSAQIAIAAQGTVDNYADNVHAIRNWNLGAVDRWIPGKTVNPNEPTIQADPENTEEVTKGKLPYDGDIKNFLSKNPEVSNAMLQFFKGILKGEYSPDTEISLGAELRKLNLALYQLAQVGKKEDSMRNEVPIPVELSFTIKGISMMKIGQVFKINRGLLLKKYDNYGYVITGVNHKVENNEWTTEVNSQFFELDNL